MLPGRDLRVLTTGREERGVGR